LFDSSQPDLDWDNPEVHEEFRSILRFWLDRGVDGFRVDVAHGLVKAPGLPDWAGHVRMVEGSEVAEGMAAADDTVAPPEASDDAASGRSPMFDQDGVHEIFREWRSVLEEYGGERILVAEAWVEPLSRLARYVRPDEMHQAFNFHFLTTRWAAPALREAIARSYAENDAVGAPTTWVLSNHDVVRHASRLGLDETGKGPNGIGADDPQPDAELGLRRARAATLLMLGLPGSAYLFQGEELGLPEHTTLDDSLRQDPAWWAERAPDVQERQEGSTLRMYREAIALRTELELGAGALEQLPAGEDVIALRNTRQGRPAVVVVTNLGAAPVALPEGHEVLIASGPLDGAAVPTDTTVWLREVR